MICRCDLGDALGSFESRNGDGLAVISLEVKADPIELSLALGVETCVQAAHPLSAFISLPLCPFAQRIVAPAPLQIAVLLFVSTKGTKIFFPQLVIVVLLFSCKVVRWGSGDVILVDANVVVDVILEAPIRRERLLAIWTLVVVLFNIFSRVSIRQTKPLRERLSFNGIHRIGIIFLFLVLVDNISSTLLVVIAVIRIDISLVIFLPIEANTAQRTRESARERHTNGIGENY